MSRTVILTGMHRSGTSLLASLFEKAGVQMGERYLPASSKNPRGFFEDLDLYQFHEDLLHARGTNMLVSRDFVFEPTVAEAERASQIVEPRAHYPLWGWKEPRTSLFLDFWHPLLPEPVYVLVYRHPLDVLLSMVRHREIYNLGLLEGLEAWYTYNVRIKAFRERHRESALLCHTYAVLAQFEKFVELLNQKLGLGLALDAETLEALFRPDELRRATLTAEMESILRVIHPDAMDLYQELESIADLPLHETKENAHPSADLSALTQFVDALPQSLQPAQRRGVLLMLLSLVEPGLTENYFSAHTDDINELERAKAWLEQQAANWQHTAEERERLIREQQAWIAELEQGKAWLEAQAANWQRTAEERERMLREQQAWIARLDEAKARLEQERDHWRRMAEEQQAYLNEVEGRAAFKALKRLGRVPGRPP